MCAQFTVPAADKDEVGGAKRRGENGAQKKHLTMPTVEMAMMDPESTPLTASLALQSC